MTIQVIPAKAGIQNRTGFRDKPGMTATNMFSCRMNNPPDALFYRTWILIFAVTDHALMV
jgi:hypothetical protein